MNYKINFGLQTYHKLNRFIDITPALYYSDGTLGLNLAVPFQVYKTENNNFGFKLSPYLKFASIDSLTVEDIRYDVDEMVLNGGVKASAGYYFNQKFSLGAFYKYSLFNKSNPMGLSKSNIEIWWFNEYDISLYYNIFEEVSIKSGIKNGGFVLSLFLSGLEMGYDITNSQFVISADLF
mgnify:CR=1 FL=1